MVWKTSISQKVQIKCYFIHFIGHSFTCNKPSQKTENLYRKHLLKIIQFKKCLNGLEDIKKDLCCTT